MMDDAGTFWSHESPGGDLQTGLDKLLGESPVNLEELLSSDEIIQECKYMNEGLVLHLSKRGVLEKLIRYTVEIPEDADMRTAERYPYVASELFACEVTSMLQGVVRDEGLLDILFSFLSHCRDVDPRHSGYFRKVVGVLIQRTYDDLVAYLKKHPDIMLTMARNMRLSVIMEILVMIGWDSSVEGERDLTWLADANLIPVLVDQLEEKNSDPDAHENITHSLIALVHTCSAGMEPNKLHAHLESKEVSEKLTALATGTQPSSTLAALRIICAMINHHGAVSADQKVKNLPPIVSLTLERVLPHASKILGKSEAKGGSLPMQYGVLSPPLGRLRLEYIRLMDAVMRMPIRAVGEAIAKSKILGECIGLMLQYPFHNILHNLVSNVVSTIVDAGPSDLREKALIQEAKLPQRICEGIKLHKARIAKRKADRMGYTGHFISITNLLEESAAKCEELREELDKVKGWKEEVCDYVEEENKNQEMTLGGRRPNTHLQDDSDDDEHHTMGQMHGDPFSTDSPGSGLDGDDPFGSAYDESWHESVSAQGTFEQQASQKANSWNNGEFEDPFGEAEPVNSSQAATTQTPTEAKTIGDKAASDVDDFAADFEAEFASQDFISEDTPKEEEQKKVEENKTEAKEVATAKQAAADDFADFEAAFGD